MSKQLAKFLLVIGSCLILLLNLVVSVNAQTPTPTPTPYPTSTPIGFQEPLTLTQDSNTVTWSQLKQSEIRLLGPYDSTAFSFGIPANWKLTEGTKLNLSLGVYINATQVIGTSTLGETGQYLNLSPDMSAGGTLTVLLNNIVLEEIPLNQVGDFTKTIPIPLEAFSSIRADGRMVLNFILDTAVTCRSYYQLNLTIRTQSNIVLPHELILPDTNLANFPQPIYQNSFMVDSAILVIPDQPTADEIRAALTMAAGLGNLSNSNLILDMATQSTLTTEQIIASHLIFVGKASSFSLPNELEFPLPFNGGKIQMEGGNPEDGFIQMINSPWNDSQVILLVTGNTDQGVVMASQALSTGVIRPGSSPNLAVVQQVQNISVPAAQPVDQTLADLGFLDGSNFSGRGYHIDSYYFNIPLGWTVAPDANFEMVFSHSALLAYEGSGITVSLNGTSIGSVRMGDETADQSSNQKQILIPASAVVPGSNRVDVTAYLVPRDECLPRNIQGLWVNIWPESTLHLPLILAPAEPSSTVNLESYPRPFIYDPSLESTAFVLLPNNLETWRAALQIASFLGDRSNGQITTLNAFYNDNIPVEERTKYNFIVIGYPSQMPILEEMSFAMPAPFPKGSDVASENFFPVDYLIPPDSPMGYVELFASPWNVDNVVLAILGNTQQGLYWASSTLIDPTLRPRLAGNYAVINGRQILTHDTRASIPSSLNNYPPQAPTVTVAAPSMESALPPAQTPIWVFPALIISLILFALILFVVIFRSWLQARSHGKHSKT